MLKFEEVDPKSVDAERRTKPVSSFSQAFVDEFMDSGIKVAAIDSEDYEKGIGNLRSILTNYCRVHKKPIKFFATGGVLHIMRIDINDDGSPNEEYEAPE